MEEEDVHPKSWYIPGLIIESIQVQTAPYYQCVRCGLASDDHDIQVPSPDHRILVHLIGKKQQDLQPMVNRLQAPEEIEQFKCTAKCAGNIELRHKRRAREVDKGLRRGRSATSQALEPEGMAVTKIRTSDALLIQIKRWVYY